MMTVGLVRLRGVLFRYGVGLAAFATFFVIFSMGHAHAAGVTCTVAGPAMTFGTINPYSGFPYSTSGTESYSCSNTAKSSATVYACFSVGTGTGGTTATNRTLASGSSTLPIQISGGPASPAQIGNGASYLMEGPLGITVGAKATTTGTFAIAVNLPAPGSAPSSGAYSSSFSSTDAQVFYTTSSAPSRCASLMSGSHDTANASFSIAATVSSQCTVSASRMAFPTASVLNNVVSATATIATTCNAKIPVTIALDNGATGTGPAARQMKSGTINKITYGIYRDAAGTLPWGNTSGTTASISAGTGTLTAYGRVPAQASPPPGSYSDVVNVMVSY